MLARKYRITLDALMKANPTLDPYNLRIGMQLCIPASANNNMSSSQAADPAHASQNDNMNNCDGRMYHTQRGDTITRILDRYEITFAALQSSNPTVDFTDSLENMALCIPAEDPYRICSMSDSYIVKNGDSLDSISRKLLVITDSLLMANPTLAIEDFSIPGTKVCIPS
jgi:LysM repeat protein